MLRQVSLNHRRKRGRRRSEKIREKNDRITYLGKAKKKKIGKKKKKEEKATKYIKFLLSIGTNSRTFSSLLSLSSLLYSKKREIQWKEKGKKDFL